MFQTKFICPSKKKNYLVIEKNYNSLVYVKNKLAHFNFICINSQN